MSKKALVVVDLQHDFVYGSMAIKGAEDLIPLIEAEMSKEEYDYCLCTLDVHPENHCSFVENGGQWPKHCVEDDAMIVYDSSEGTKMSESIIWFKGMNPNVDSYSAFFDNDKNPLGLTQYLKALDITELVIVGVATDYCLKYTALDAKSEGFDVTVLNKLCRAVNPDGVDIVLGDLIANGINVEK